MPLNGNYRKPQLADSRLVLVSFKDGKYGLQNELALLLGNINDMATVLLQKWQKDRFDGHFSFR